MAWITSLWGIVMGSMPLLAHQERSLGSTSSFISLGPSPVSARPCLRCLFPLAPNVVRPGIQQSNFTRVGVIKPGGPNGHMPGDKPQQRPFRRRDVTGR